MNWEHIEDQWKQFAIRVKDRWQRLTDDDIRSLDASKADLVRKIRERYGVSREDAELQVEGWLTSIAKPSTPATPPHA